MGQLDKKQLNIFAKALMPELYKIQARFNEWDKAIQEIVTESRKNDVASPLESAGIKDKGQDANKQSPL